MFSGRFPVFFDDSFGRFDGLLELSIVIFDGVVIDIGMVQPLPGVGHSFREVVFGRVVPVPQACFDAFDRGGYEYGDDTREELLRRDDAFPFHLPYPHLPASCDALEFIFRHTVEFVIVFLCPFDKSSLGDSGLEKGFFKKVVRMTFRFSRSWFPRGRGDDTLYGDALREAFDDGVLAGAGRTGDDEEKIGVHNSLAKVPLGAGLRLS